ncbi:unnamed protein product [Mytilus coruscus]|uniref:Endonuclease/exonuclease/phosphatase domain-containing protein n=1 Tax=Mytilus coruscus TaxID=42192 RepID=A0A6J8DH60_MYTCO|nr:unnamed protein product [Mytilus coruscus]
MKRRLDMNTNANSIQGVGLSSTSLNEQIQGKINNRILTFHEKLTNLVMDRVANQLQKVVESLNIPDAEQDIHHESKGNNPRYENGQENMRTAMNCATTVSQSTFTNSEAVQNIQNNDLTQAYRINNQPRMDTTSNYPGCNVITQGYNVNCRIGQFIRPDALNNNNRPLDDGRERTIQCVEVLGKDNNNLLLISIDLPSTGSRDHNEEFLDTIDQLNEIVLKYQDTHYMIIRGDLNEDLIRKQR